MSKTTQFKAPTDTGARVHRREFLCLAPSAALASSIPLGVTLPRPSGNQVSISEALAALWDHSEEGFASIIKPSTAERLDGFALRLQRGADQCFTIRSYDGGEPRPMRQGFGPTSGPGSAP